MLIFDTLLNVISKAQEYKVCPYLHLQCQIVAVLKKIGVEILLVVVTVNFQIHYIIQKKSILALFNEEVSFLLGSQPLLLFDQAKDKKTFCKIKIFVKKDT